MANRFPLVIDTSNGNKIAELPETDNLNLANSDISEVRNINVVGDITLQGTILNNFSGDYDDLSNKPVLFSGDYDDLTSLPTLPTSILDLGIIDGTSGQLLSTDGDGNFTFIDAPDTGGVSSWNDLLDKPVIPSTLIDLGINDGSAGQFLVAIGNETYQFQSLTMIENFQFSSNSINATNVNGNIIFTPNGTGYVQVNGTNGLVIPVGTDAQQGPDLEGAIRFNTDTSQFEGYNGTTWSSLGGVRDADGNTYISPESAPGANENILYFVINDNQRLQLTNTTFDLDSAVVMNVNNTAGSTSSSNGALVVDGGVGIAENLNVGGNTRITGSVTIDSTTASTTTSTGAIVVTGGAGVGGNLNVGGNTVITGNATVNGNATIGNATTDTVTLNAQLTSNIIPSTNDTYDLGTSSKKWQSLYLSSTANINDYTLPTADGTINQIIKTDGAGNLSFADADAFGGNRIYVSAAKGNDSNDGVTAPVATIKRGVQLATELAYSPATPVQSKEDQGLLLLANKDFIAEEVIEYINLTYPSLDYDEALCRRDAVEIVESAVYDLRFGGNSRSATAGRYYYDAQGNTYVSGQITETVAAIDYAKSLAASIMVNTLVTPVRGNLTQTIDETITTDAGNVTAIEASFDIVADIVETGLGAIPTLVYGSYVTQQITVMVATGNYVEQNPIILGDDISIIGDNLRRTIIRPANANRDMFRVRNSSYVTGVTFRDHIDETRTPDFTFRYCISFDNALDTATSRTGYVNLPARKPKIFTSPYIQNCSVLSFLGGNGVEVDGDLVDTPNTPPTNIEAENPVNLADGIPEQGKSMVANAFTILSFGGNAWRVINDAYAQIVSCFVIFTENGCLTQNGGYLSITNSASNFGLFALRSTGYSQNSFAFDRGIIYGNGIEEAYQTLKVNNLQRPPLEHFVIRIRNSVGTDITNNYNSDVTFGVTESLTPTVDNVGSNTITFATAHDFENGDYVEYDSNGNVEIVGLLNEVKYYVSVINAAKIALYHDEAQTKPVRNLDASLCSGTHLFKTGYEEFFINEVLSSHNTYQDLILPSGPTYTINLGDTISGLNGVSIVNASIAQWDPITRTLTVSIELVQEGLSQVRNSFGAGSTINAGEVSTGAISISSVTNRTDLFSSEFSLISSYNRPMVDIGTTSLNQIYLHRPSICNSSAHTWEYSGSGTDYNALPQNGGQTDEFFEQVSTLPGRVYSSGTNEIGDFKVGDFVRAYNRTGNIDFRNRVTIGELDSLALSLSSGIVVNEISTDIELGDNEIDGAKHTRLTTQLAIRSFLDNRLGNFIDQNLSTNAIPSAVVQLNSQGQINPDLIPPQGNFTSYAVNEFEGRLELHNDIPVKDLRPGDIIIETYDEVTLTLDSAVSVVKGETITQANSGATGIVKATTTSSNSIKLVAPFSGTFTDNVADTLTGSTTGALSTYPSVVAGPNEVKDNYFLTTSRTSQYLVLDEGTSYDFTDIISNETLIQGAVSGAVATVDEYRTGVLTAVDVVNDIPGGSGYTTPGTYTNVTVTNVSGSGTGAKADVIVSGGQITSFDITRGGSGYTESDVLSVADGTVGGRSGGTAFEINVTDIENRLYVTLNQDAGLEFNATSINLDYIIDDNVSPITIANQAATSNISFDATSSGVGGAVDVSADTIDFGTAHGFENGDAVEYDSNSNIVLGGLTNNAVYHVKAISTDIIELYSDYSLQVANKINITSSSTGNHILITRVVNTADNRFYVPAHGLITGDAVRYDSSNPPALINDDDYLFVGSVTTNTFTLHQARGAALDSVGGLVVTPVDLTATGSGSADVIKQNVSVIGDANTSGQFEASWSSLSNTTVDADNIISGIINPSRLGTGSANNNTFLRGDSSYAFAVQGIKNSEADDPITLTGSNYNDGSDDVYYGVVDIKIENAGYDNPVAPSSGTERKGIAAFDFNHFTVDTDGLVVTKSSGDGGVIDADTLDGQQGSYYVNPINLSRAVPVEKGGTNQISYTKGDILYAATNIGNGTFAESLSKLTVGAGNTVLVVNNSTLLPSWSNALTLNELTVDNVRIGISSTNEIDTTTGGLTLDSASGTVTVDDNLVVTGNLTVSGTVTTVLSETVEIEDVNILLAKNASNATEANGAGLTVNVGTNAPAIDNPTITYNSTNDTWVMNKDLEANAATAAQVFVQSIATNAAHYLTFVNSNNGTAAAETVYTDAGISYNPSTNDLSISGNLLLTGANKYIQFEGTTADAFETFLYAGEPTADRTITLPDATGTVALTSDIGNGTLTVSAGTGVSLSASPTFTANQSGNTTITVTNSDRGSSQNIFKTITVTDTDSGNTWASTGNVVAANNSDTVTFVDGGGVDISVDAVTQSILIQHTDTSSQATVTNTGTSVIQSVTLDTYGHVTALGSATINTYDGWSLYVNSVDRGNIAESEIVNFIAGTNVTLDYNATNNAITINSTDTNTDTNTTYDLSIVQNAGSNNNPIVRLAAGGSGTGNDDIILTGGTNVTITRTSATGITISSSDTNTDNYVDSVAFATGTGILTLGRTGALADLTVDLDGRYLTAEADTLDTVTGRSNTTSNTISTGNHTITTANNAGTLFLTRTDTTPNDNDAVGIIHFNGPDSAQINTTYARIQGLSTDVTNTTEDGRLSFQTIINGTIADRVTIDTQLNSYLDLYMGTGTGIIFEGAVASAFETMLIAGSPTQINTLTLPDRSGTIATVEDIADFITGESDTLASVVARGNTTSSGIEVGSLNGHSIPSGGGTLALISDIPTNNNQLTNGAGYITTESDTLATITGRGSSTTNGITVGSLTSTGALSVQGNTTLGDATTDTITFTARASSTLNPNANNTISLGSSSLRWNTVYATVFDGVATSARYADLAEVYSTDIDYEPGTVVMFGGEAELTAAYPHGTRKVAGVISTDPAYLMNSAAKGQPIALKGRVPCKVVGKVAKGDMLIASDIPGVAIASEEWIGGAMIGKAIESSNDEGVKIIEIAVGVL